MLALALVIQGMTVAHHVHAEPTSTEGISSHAALDGLSETEQSPQHDEHGPNGGKHHRDCPACLVSALGLHVLLAVVTIDWPPSSNTQTAIDLQHDPRPSAPREGRTIRGPPAELNA
jgi:hypothetical protein